MDDRLLVGTGIYWLPGVGVAVGVVNNKGARGIPPLVCLNVDRLQLDSVASLDYYCPMEWAWQWVWSVTVSRP